jgi:putative lipoprotein
MTSEPRLTIQGEVFYLPKIMLPTACTLTVSLNEISLADAAARNVAISKTKITQQVPLAFELSYVPNQPAGSYAVSASIECEGRLIWVSNTTNMVKVNEENIVDLRVKVVQVNA